MKLVSLELAGFRGFAKTQVFDLNADAIIVVGANGNGKTSLFDGILWALCGHIPRLAQNNPSVVSLYSESGQARAALTFSDEALRSYKVTRSVESGVAETRVSLESSEGILSGPSAEGRLLQLLWPEAATATEPLVALASVLTRSVYLQQDVLRHFIEPADDHERFSSVSELFGAGRVTELQVSLERAKKAWSTATNQRTEEIEGLRLMLNSVETRARDLETRFTPNLQPVSNAAWAGWWNEATAAGLNVNVPDFSSRDAARAIDAAIKEIASRRTAAERKEQSLRMLQPQLAALAILPIAPSTEVLHAQSISLQNDLDVLKRQVIDEQGRQADLRRAQAALQQKDEQLRVLASLALQHLGDHCPVCAQDFDREATRRRLLALTEVSGSTTISEPPSTRLNDLLAGVSAKEKELGALAMLIRSAQQKALEQELQTKAVSERLTEMGITSPEPQGRQEQLERALDGVVDQNAKLRELQQSGEGLALTLSQSAAQSALIESRSEIERLKRAIVEKQVAISSRNDTGTIAQLVIEGLREAASTVVEQRLAQVTPLLQNIYSRIDPHPAFETVQFLSRVTKGRGLLSTVVRDSLEDKSCPHPPSVFSSSQVNALAVSIFLSFNLGVARPPFTTLLLDDPLQCLDDVNLLGLVDLLRRTKDRRQLCVSTHDSRFASLLARKLRPSGTGSRTILIELEGWHREGPAVSTREVSGDPVELRLAAG